MLSRRVRSVISLARASSQPVDLSLRSVLINNLRMTYHVIRASERLLIEAAKHTSNELLSDYFIAHLKEEKNHAFWLARDLLSAGYGVKYENPHPLAASIAGAAYYYIWHVHPACLLGYMAALECYSSDMTVIEQLEKAHGVDLIRTARHHAEHDPQHAADLMAVIDKVGHPGILMAAEQTANRIASYKD